MEPAAQSGGDVHRVACCLAAHIGRSSNLILLILVLPIGFASDILDRKVGNLIAQLRESLLASRLTPVHDPCEHAGENKAAHQAVHVDVGPLAGGQCNADGPPADAQHDAERVQDDGERRLVDFHDVQPALQSKDDEQERDKPQRRLEKSDEQRRMVRGQPGEDRPVVECEHDRHNK